MPKRPRWLRDAAIGYGFLVPNIIGFMLFTFFPIFGSLALAFFGWDLIGCPKWVGLSNFVELLGFHYTDSGSLVANDPKFWKYLWNTVYLMAGIPLGMAGSLALAVALNQKLRGTIFLRTIYFLPSMCIPVAVFMMWRWIYHPEFGLLNWFLSLFSIEGPRWLLSPVWAKPALILTGFWVGVGGYNMILYLAALQNIPNSYYEAAKIDGASFWQQFCKITLPLVTPTTFFILIISIISGFQGGFEAAYMMTGGGPIGSTKTIIYYIYDNAFGDYYRMGYAAAISWILFVLIMGFTIFNWKFGGKRVHYH